MTATWSIRINAVDAAARIKNLPASAETRITASRGVQANAETAVRASSDEGVIEFSSMMSGCASRALRPSYIASFFYAKPYRYDNIPLPEDMADAYNLSMAPFWKHRKEQSTKPARQMIMWHAEAGAFHLLLRPSFGDAFARACAFRIYSRPPTMCAISEITRGRFPEASVAMSSIET